MAELNPSSSALSLQFYVFLMCCSGLAAERQLIYVVVSEPLTNAALYGVVAYLWLKVREVYAS